MASGIIMAECAGERAYLIWVPSDGEWVPGWRTEGFEPTYLRDYDVTGSLDDPHPLVDPDWMGRISFSVCGGPRFAKESSGLTEF